MQNPNTNPAGLKAHQLRPAKGAKLVIKDAAAFEPGAGFALRPLIKQRRADQRAAAVNNTSRMSGRYNGAELRPYDGRPHSLDFLALPSLMGKTRVYRKDQTTPETQA